MNRSSLVHEWMVRNAGALCCPVCGGALGTRDAGSVRCAVGHSFDISSKGSLTLAQAAAPSKYDRPMLTSRRAIARSGFFDALETALAEALCRYLPCDEPRLLDAGCGEGSALHSILALLAGRGRAAEAAGVDLSKEGIRLAASAYAGPLWCMADLTRLPFANGTFHAILNILSPTNHWEFTRVLAPGGVVLKAVPGAAYLSELRQALYGGDERESYNNDEVLRHFAQGFELLERRLVRAEVSIPAALWPDLIAMTPLTWPADEERRANLLAHPQPSVTAEWLLLVGQPRHPISSDSC